MVNPRTIAAGIPVLQGGEDVKFVKQPSRRIRDARKSRVIKTQIVRRRKAEREQAEVFRRVMA